MNLKGFLFLVTSDKYFYRIIFAFKYRFSVTSATFFCEYFAKLIYHFMKNISTAFRIKNSKNDVKNDGTTSIYLYININNSIKWQRTGISVRPEHFDNDSGTVRKGNKDFFRINNQLSDFRQNYTEAIYHLEQKKKLITHQTIETFFKNKESGYDEDSKDNNDFIQYAYSEIKNIDTSVSSKHYETVKMHIDNLKKYQASISFKELTPGYLAKYKNYLTAKGNSINTQAGAFRSIRLLINKARKEGETTIRPFDDFRILSQETEIEYLTKDEIIKLHELYITKALSDRLQNTLHYFLLSCYTGLRKGDVSRLNKNHLDADTLTIIPNKTRKKGKILRIPLSDRAKQLINNEIDTIFKRPLKQSSSKLTSEIKEILIQLKINKHITFHGSRHTFAVNGLVLGIPLKVISELLGHASVSTTEIYAKVVDELKVSEMKKWDF